MLSSGRLFWRIFSQGLSDAHTQNLACVDHLLELAMGIVSADKFKNAGKYSSGPKLFPLI
jgi:hypothetical protein